MSKIYQKKNLDEKTRLKRHFSGFTLIELLVVVLIIGILAAVALPQYQIAVKKSKAVSLLSLGRSIIEAEKLYFMTNGAYCYDFNDLGISLPSNMACSTGFYADGDCSVKKDKISGYALAYKNGNPRLHITGEDVVFVWPFTSSSPLCYSNLDPARERLCKALGGVPKEGDPSYYVLPL